MGTHPDIWATTLALGGFAVLGAVGAGLLGSRPANPEPSRARRLAIAVLLALSGLCGLAIAALWLVRLSG